MTKTAYAKTDIRRMREDKGSGGGSLKIKNLYNLSSGVHTLRLLPPKEPGPFYFKYFNHKLGRDWEVCPQFTWGERCPVCILSDKLHKSTDQEEVERGSALWRRESYLAAVVDTKNPTKGVQVIRFGVRLRDALSAMFVDEDEAKDAGVEPLDLTDPENGAIIRVQSGQDSNGYNTHTPSILATGKGIPYKNWVKELPDLKAVVREQTKGAKQLQEMMMASVGTEEESSEADVAPPDDDERYSARKGREKPEKVSVEVGAAITGQDDEGRDYTGVVVEVSEDDDEVIIKDTKGKKRILQLSTVKVTEDGEEDDDEAAAKTELKRGMRVVGEDDDGDSCEGDIVSVDAEDEEVIIKDDKGKKHILQLDTVELVKGKKKGG